MELPTSNPAKSDEYWRLFKGAMHNAILHDIKIGTDGNKLDQNLDQNKAPEIVVKEAQPEKNSTEAN